MPYKTDNSCCINSETTDIHAAPEIVEAHASSDSDSEAEMLRILGDENFVSELTEEPTISGLHVDSLLHDLQKDIPETDAQRKENKVVEFLQQHNKEVENFLTIVHVNLSQKMQSENTLTN